MFFLKVIKRKKELKMLTINIDEEIQKELNSLAPEENDVDKIAKMTHRSLLLMSVKNAVIIMAENEHKINEEENEMDLFHQLIRKLYLEKLDFIRKELLS